MSTTPYMSLLLPTVSTTLGPAWATDLNEAFSTVDSHDHTSGKGVAVPSSGLNINADLPFNSVNATLLRSTRFAAQGAPLALVTDIACLYASGVDLWFNDGDGNQIQLTAGGALNAASIGGIGGDYTTSTATVFYTDSTDTFSFWQDTNERAKIDCADILLRKTTASSAAITIKADASLASGWSLTLPIAPPAATGPVMCDASGNISFLAAPSATEIGYVTGLTQSAQTQIDRLRLEPGSTYNLGISYSAGVFSVLAADASSLSVTAYGSVCVPSTTAGRHVTLKVTANATFQDDAGTSDLTNLGFGITEAADWAEDMPFFLYVVNRGNTDLDGVDGSSAFFIARNPNLSTTPASADDIGDTGAIPVNDSQNVILILDDVTVANYVSLPCQLIGAFRMQWLTSSDDWTVQTLGNNDGIGKNQLDKTFATNWTMPLGQNGATASKFMADNGGTAPQFTNNNYEYKLSKDGIIEGFVDLNGDGGANGAGSVDAQLALPATSSSSFALNIGTALALSNAPTSFIVLFRLSASEALTTMVRATPSAGDLTSQTDTISNAFFVSGARNIRGDFRFKAY